jgi:hydrogenase maturation protease
MKRLLVLCLGNEVLSDDAFGPLVAHRLQDSDLGCDDVEVLYAPTAGLSLLELLEDRLAVLIVDTILTDRAQPGTVHSFPIGNSVPSNNLINSHEVSLPTALALGRQLGYAMPDDIQVLAVEAGDVTLLSEQLTPAVASAVEPALRAVAEWIRDKAGELSAEAPMTTIGR